MFHRTRTLAQEDPELAAAIAAENLRQEDHIELIASENYASPAVLAAQGSQLTNKYAEGYPGKRYYGGCEYVDVAERLAIDRAKRLFGAEWANVQPHWEPRPPGSPAAPKPGDTILDESAHGGHRRTPAGQFAAAVQRRCLGSIRTELIDYDDAERLAQKHKPKLVIAGASAYSRVIDWKRFKEIADGVGALLMVDMAHYAGLVAADVYPSPVGIADFVTTTTHKTLRGPRGGLILGQPEQEKATIRRFPTAGGRHARDRREGRRAAGGARQDFRVIRAGARQRARACHGAPGAWIAHRPGGTASHMFLVDSARRRDHRQGAGGRPVEGAHQQQERDTTIRKSRSSPPASGLAARRSRRAASPSSRAKSSRTSSPTFSTRPATLPRSSTCARRSAPSRRNSRSTADHRE